MTRHISDQLMSRLSNFVTSWLGLHYPKNRWRDLHRSIAGAARELGIPDVHSCVNRLLMRQFTREQEELLANHLTIGETYFFREQKSFEVLEKQILPDLIESRRENGKRLRIWSAGCSTGEEPYSIAILLTRLIPDPAEWQITILASDINTRSLAKAAHGVYGEWSFRGVPQWMRQRYFTKTGDGSFELSHAVQRMVSFAVLNLSEDSYPSLASNTGAMDIIFCRNVLMYFERSKQLRVIDGFRRSLVDGGWLAVSPCETSSDFSPGFETVFFPGTIFYQKGVRAGKAVDPVLTVPGRDHPREWTPPAPEPLFMAAAPVPVRVPTGLPEPGASAAGQPEPEHCPLVEAQALYRRGNYEEAVAGLSGLLLTPEAGGGPSPLFEQAATLMARCLANLGRVDQALEWVEKAIGMDRLNAELYYLRATICQEQGQPSPAIASLKQALYLDHDFVLAHFSLGTLTLQQGMTKDAERHFENARLLLDALPAEEPVPGSEGMTAARLSEIIAATRAGIARQEELRYGN